jgi:hypothetical protein
MHAIRGYTLEHVTDLDEAKQLKTPDGLTNNVIWNLGHTLVVQCQLSYLACGKSSPLPDGYSELFAPGTSPKDWKTQPDCAEVIEHSKTLNKKIAEDLAAGAFADYPGVPLTKQYKLDTIEEALNFHIVHEGMHTGVMLAIRHLI